MLMVSVVICLHGLNVIFGNMLLQSGSGDRNTHAHLDFSLTNTLTHVQTDWLTHIKLENGKNT